MSRRRRTRAYVVTVGTSLYLARGADPIHALEAWAERYGPCRFRLEDVRVREATPADLRLLADVTGNERELAAWAKLAGAQGAAT